MQDAIKEKRVWNYNGLRVYLGCKMGWFFASATSYFLTYERLGENASFEIIERYADLRFWGVVLFLLGVLGMTTIVWTTAWRARRYMVCCFGVEFLFACAIFSTMTWSPLVPTYMLLAAFDFFMVRAKMVDG